MIVRPFGVVMGGGTIEKNISAEYPEKEKRSWLQKPYELSFRQKGFSEKKTKGQKGTVCIV